MDKDYFTTNHTKKKKAPVGVILLKNCKIDKLKGKLSGKSGFEVSGKHLKRTYELLTQSKKEQENWIKELGVSIAGKKSEPVVSKSSDEPLVVDTGKTEALVGGTIGLKDFDLLCVLGRGAFGKVIKVRKKDTKAIYAMKVLAKDMLIKQKMVEYTKSEKSILQQIDHPYIVHLRYAFQTPSKLYLVLDFLSGGELFFHLSKEVKFDVDRARFYTAELVLALGHLHEKDIIYRDLKPENVVLDGEGHIQMTDFGLAKSSISNQNPTYTFCGTPEYLAPEIINGKGHSKPVDWWSLGILLYEMLVGLPPFYSENINEMYELILKTPLKFPSFVPSDAQGLLKCLLERDPGKRIGSGSSDYKEIMKHEFFKKIEWDKMMKRQVPPPFVPKGDKDDGTAGNFDTEFTSERVVDSFAVNVKEEKADFGDFDFVS